MFDKKTTNYLNLAYLASIDIILSKQMRLNKNMPIILIEDTS